MFRRMPRGEHDSERFAERLRFMRAKRVWVSCLCTTRDRDQVPCECLLPQEPGAKWCVSCEQGIHTRIEEQEE